MKKPDIKRGKWEAVEFGNSYWITTPLVVGAGIFKVATIHSADHNSLEDTAKAIAQVPNMIDALIEARKAIKNAEDDSFGFSESDFGGGKLVKYPLKDELLNKIEQVLLNAGCKP